MACEMAGLAPGFWTVRPVPARQTPGGLCVIWEFYGMVTASRSRLPIILVFASALLLAACTSLPGPGAGAPTLGPIAAANMKAAPVKGDGARFALPRSPVAPAIS